MQVRFAVPHRFHTKPMDFVLNNDGLCPENDGLCTENDGFYAENAGTTRRARPITGTTTARQNGQVSVKSIIFSMKSGYIRSIQVLFWAESGLFWRRNDGALPEGWGGAGVRPEAVMGRCWSSPRGCGGEEEHSVGRLLTFVCTGNDCVSPVFPYIFQPSFCFGRFSEWLDLRIMNTCRRVCMIGQKSGLTRLRLTARVGR